MPESEVRLSDAELKALIDKFIEAKAEENQYYSATVGVRPSARPPASSEDLDALQAHLSALGLRFPPSYRQFLSTYNGVEGLLYPLNLYGVKEVMSHDTFIEAMFEEYPGCKQFVVAGSPRSGDVVSFDVNAPTSGGGYEVVWLTAEGDAERDADFVSFLRAYLQVTRDTIAKEKADRANLQP
jgi:hypothetical protein